MTLLQQQKTRRVSTLQRLFHYFTITISLFQRLFHCVSERDVFGWPKLTTTAMEIELLAACVPESTRVKIIKELDPDDMGEVGL